MLTFALSEDQTMVQDQVRKFAAEELRPRHRELEKARAVPAALQELASEAQAARLLRVMRRGALAWTGSTGTTARRDGGDWILEGGKAAVVNGGTADVHVVFAHVGDQIGAFALLGTQPGLSAGPRAEWVGLETVDARPLELRGVRVPDSDRLDQVSAAALQRMFARLSLMSAARQEGLARASAEYALAYTQDRVAFGKPVAHFQAIAFTLADMLTDV